MSGTAARRIPLVDLGAQYQSLKPEIDQAIQRVLDRGQFILGPEVEALEREVASLCQVAHGIGVANGTDALELALRAIGVGPGDEVITTALSFFATAEAIALVGAVPIFVDIDEATYNLDPALIEPAITPRTKAMIPVHLYGQPCDMDKICAVARQHGLKIVEDCAQAIGATYAGRPVGSFGAAAGFSFYPSKNLGAYGDGGMVVTNDAALAQQVRLWRAHGSTDNATHRFAARNSRLDELQAAILRAKLPHLQAWNQARRRHADTYRRLIKEARLQAIVVPQELPGCTSVYHLFVIRCAARDAIRQALLARGIGAQVHYAASLPQQPALASLRLSADRYPKALRAAQEVLSLPLYPELSDADARRVVDALAEALRSA